MKPRLCLLAELHPSVAEWVERNFDIVYRKRADNYKNDMIEEDLAEILLQADPDVAIIEAQPFTSRVFEKARRLSLIVSVRTTPSNVDTEAAREKGVTVANAPGRNATAVAEFTIALILCCARFIPQAYHALKSGQYLLPPGQKALSNPNDVIWTHPALVRRPYMDFRGREICGATLGLFGFGQIGRMVAERARALGMSILVHDPYVDSALVQAQSGVSVDMQTLLKKADFLSLHAKATAETRRIIDKKVFDAMKPTAYLINTARGALVHQADLLDALSRKVIAGAAIDVYESEPLSLGDDLLALDNLIYTPHIGGATVDVVRHQSKFVEQNLEAWLAGKTPPNIWPAKL